MNLCEGVYTHRTVTCRGQNGITAQNKRKNIKIITDCDPGIIIVPESVALFKIWAVFPDKSRKNAHRDRSTVAILNSE